MENAKRKCSDDNVPIPATEFAEPFPKVRAHKAKRVKGNCFAIEQQSEAPILEMIIIIIIMIMQPSTFSASRN